MELNTGVNMPADVTAYITALGQIAASKRPAKQAPGGISTATPAPRKIRSADGVTDSDFIRQIITASQGNSDPMAAMAMGNNTGMPQQMGTAPQPMGQPGQSGGGMAGLAQMLQGVMK